MKDSMLLDQIWIYPVKSLPGIRLGKSAVNARGLAWDRHWMLVDKQGHFLSQRKLPKMALIGVRLEKDGIRLSAAQQGSLLVNFVNKNDEAMPVKVWNDELQAQRVGTAVDQWLSAFLGEPVFLVSMPDNTVRVVDPDYALPDDQTGFSDGFPFLLIGQASLDDLNLRINRKNEIMTMQRFRPNLVISGSPAFAEDHWQAIQIGNIGFRVVKPCSRCTITTVNPRTAERGAEPLKTLAQYRKRGNKVYFGQNLIQDDSGVLTVGDALSVIYA